MYQYLKCTHKRKTLVAISKYVSFPFLFLGKILIGKEASLPCEKYYVYINLSSSQRHAEKVILCNS